MTDSTSYNRTLPLKHSASSFADATNYIERRKSGQERSLDTGFPKLNKALTGGLD